MSRVSGWTAHCMEQRANNRIIRPSADYIGVEHSEWIDIKDNFLPFYEMLQYHYKLDYQIINKEPKHLELSHNMYFHNSEVNDDININRADYIKICINSKI